MPTILLSHILAWVLIVASCSSLAALPNIDGSSTKALTRQRERLLGEHLMADLYQTAWVDADPLLCSYIAELGNTLATYARDQDIAYHFFVVRDPHINAFALPGGFVGVHSGLFLLAQTESELASVLAHEIAHIDQHHLSRQLEQAQQHAIPGIALIATSVLLGTQHPGLGTGALAASMTGLQYQHLYYSRLHEQEADWLGLSYLSQSHFSPMAMPTFFARMSSANIYNESTAPHFLRTHPLTQERISSTADRAALLEEPIPRDDLSFELMRARIKYLITDNHPELLRDFRTYPWPTDPQNVAALYGQALCLRHMKQTDQALSLLNQALEKAPDASALRIEKAEVLLDQHQPSAAMALLRQSPEKLKSTPPLAMALANIYMNQHQPAQAIQILNAVHASSPTTPAFNQLLAKAHSQNNAPGLSHLCQADFYFKLYDPDSARLQLKLALAALPEDDSYHRARAQAKLKHAESLLKKQRQLL